MTINSLMTTVDEVYDDVVDFDEAPKTEFKKVMPSGELSQKSMSENKWVEKDKDRGKKFVPMLKPIPWLPPPFPQRVKY